MVLFMPFEIFWAFLIGGLSLLLGAIVVLGLVATTLD
jgi:hypothetical protein